VSEALTSPAVTVVMANRDAGPYVAQAVRSVLAQTLAELELIFVDDRSSDDSVRRALDAAAGDPRMKIEQLTRSLGPGGARNRALARARGRWIAVVDSDDVIAPDRLERLIAFAETRGAELAADNLMLFSEAGEQGPLLRGADWTGPREIRLAEFVRSNRLYGRGASLGYLKPVIRRSALGRTGAAYDEGLRVGEDFQLVAELLAAGARYWVDPTPLYRYRRHAGSTSHRLRRSDIEALLAADDRFRCLGERLTPADLAALNGRRRSLERALAYDGLVAALKARSAVRAVSQALADPSAVPLLLTPLAARISRLRGAT
jgi:succinoglycan biosynthesis protein ExoO